MTKIDLKDGAAPERALDTARASLEARGWSWEQQSSSEATASEDGGPIGDAEVGLSHRLRVRIRVEQGRLHLDQQTVGAAMAGAAASVGAGPWLTIQLARRFRKTTKTVRADLQAADMTS